MSGRYHLSYKAFKTIGIAIGAVGIVGSTRNVLCWSNNVRAIYESAYQRFKFCDIGGDIPVDSVVDHLWYRSAREREERLSESDRLERGQAECLRQAEP